MRTAKVIGLGILFSFVAFVALSIITTMRLADAGTSHATGVSVIVAGILEALFSPITWLVILAAFGAAFWLVRRPA